MAAIERIEEVRARGLDPGHGEVPHRAFRRGAGAGGARRRLHRRERGADARRRPVPRRQARLQRAVRVRRARPRRGAAPDRRGRGHDPHQGRGRAPATSSRRCATCAQISRDLRELARWRRRRADGAAKALGAPYELVVQVADERTPAGAELRRRRHRHARRRRALHGARRGGGVRRLRASSSPTIPRRGRAPSCAPRPIARTREVLAGARAGLGARDAAASTSTALAPAERLAAPRLVNASASSPCRADSRRTRAPAGARSAPRPSLVRHAGRSRRARGARAPRRRVDGDARRHGARRARAPLRAFVARDGRCSARAPGDPPRPRRDGARPALVRRARRRRRAQRLRHAARLVRRRRRRGRRVSRAAGVFIRAPRIVRVGPGVEVLARVGGEPVLVRSGATWAATFHPELSEDARVHRAWLHEVS